MSSEKRKINLSFTNLARKRELIATIVQTIIIVSFSFIITIIQCSFDLKEFNWLRFTMNILFSLTMKLIYTRYAKTKELLNEDITLLQNTIDDDRRIIFEKGKTQTFNDEVERRNKIEKLEAYIDYLDSRKLNQKSEKKRLKAQADYEKQRKWAFEYKKALINEENIEPFESIRTLDSVKIYYERIDASKLFTYGKSSKPRKNKYTFNAFSSSFNRAVVPFTVSVITSIIFGLIKPDASINGQMWIDLIGYLFSIVMGIWWGITNGRTIITEDYYEVLTNVSMLVRDIKNKILNKEEEKKNENDT